MENLYTECNTEEGITIALIDGIIAQLRLLSRMEKTPQVMEALADLKHILNKELCQFL